MQSKFMNHLRIAFDGVIIYVPRPSFVSNISPQYWMVMNILEVNLKWKDSMYAIKTAYTHK